MKRFGLFLIVSILFFYGCATVEGPITKKKYSSEDDLEYQQEMLEHGRRQYIKKYPDLSLEMNKAIAEGKIIKGMSKEEVRASWGAPTIVYRTATNNVVNEQWIYKDIDYTNLTRRSYYLNFKDNLLYSWQY
ncbi:MAG: hypothetical protein KJ593_00550 [Candidatus Omnitrophica bacterium]|nr:hypothetical protein [Candidatus Omnitrophota bacterium]